MHQLDRGCYCRNVNGRNTCLTPVERMSGMLVYMLWIKNLRVWENHGLGIVPYMYALLGH
jgi:hypothetical protein